MQSFGCSNNCRFWTRQGACGASADDTGVSASRECAHLCSMQPHLTGLCDSWVVEQVNCVIEHHTSSF